MTRDALPVAVFCLVISMIGVAAGQLTVIRCVQHPDALHQRSTRWSSQLAPWDGVWYRRIATVGYQYDRNEMSSVAFYPLYPAVAGLAVRISGLHVDDALAITSQGALIAAFVVFGRYLHHRSHPVSEDSGMFMLLALGLFPTTFWMKMSYSESTFLLVMLLAMLGMARRWRPLWIAVIIGLATSARPMGVALIPPFLWHLWDVRDSSWTFVRNIVLLLPLCVWGILFFMVYQWYAFHEPLAFIRTAAHWNEQLLPGGWRAWIVAHTRLEPLWQVYNSKSSCCWKNDPPDSFPLFSMSFMNPVFVLFTWSIVGWGVWAGRLCAKETLLSMGLLAIPYLTHAWRACGSSEARYASVVFPFYIILGQILSRMPSLLSTLLLALSAVLLAIYSALFVQWYWFY